MGIVCLFCCTCLTELSISIWMGSTPVTLPSPENSGGNSFTMVSMFPSISVCVNPPDNISWIWTRFLLRSCNSVNRLRTFWVKLYYSQLDSIRLPKQRLWHPSYDVSHSSDCDAGCCCYLDFRSPNTLQPAIFPERTKLSYSSLVWELWPLSADEAWPTLILPEESCFDQYPHRDWF